MHLLVGKFDDLVFDRRAIARPDGLDLPAIHRRAVHVLADDAVGFGRGPRNVAGNLRVVMRHALGAEAEGSGVGIARLHREARPVDGASVKARRRSGLQPAAAQAELLQSLAEQNCVGFAGASGGILLLAAVDQSVEKSAGGDDDGLARPRCGRREGECRELRGAGVVVVSLSKIRFEVFGIDLND